MRVPESIGELRAICQLSAQWQVHHPWAFLQIRKASIYLTWLLLHTPVTANGVTLIGILLAIGAALLFGSTHFFAGTLALHLSILCDFSDGEVSRYRKEQSKQGSYLDKVYHFTVNPCVFAGLTIGAYQTRPSLWILVLGFVTTSSVPAFGMVAGYGNELAIWRHSRKLVDKLNSAKDANGRDVILAAILDVQPRRNTSWNDGTPITSSVANRRFVRRISEMSAFWDFPYIFWVITVAVLVRYPIPLLTMGQIALTPVEVILLFYALTYPGWILLYLTHVLKTHATERGYVAFAHELSKLASKASSTKALAPDR